jgi:hypothetical protein
MKFPNARITSSNMENFLLVLTWVEASLMAFISGKSSSVRTSKRNLKARACSFVVSRGIVVTSIKNCSALPRFSFSWVCSCSKVTSSVVGENLISEVINSRGSAFESHANIAFLMSVYDILNRDKTIAMLFALL